MNNYDLIIIGAGPGGYETAAEAAASGMKVLLVERSHPGGTCLNLGCIPTKALCRSAEVFMEARRAAEFGVDIAGEVKLDYSRVAARKDAIVRELQEGVMSLLKDVDYLHGEARFTGAHTIDVGGESFTAPQIIVATGSVPARLPIKGDDLACSSDDLLAATELPASIVIIGGGVIGMEFASILNAFGVEVTVLEFCPEILPVVDAEVAKRLRMSLKRRGIRIITSAMVLAIEPGMTVSYSSKGKMLSVGAESVLMAVGRRPVIPEGLLETGVATDRRGFVAVDSRMRTSVDGIYAIGDVNGICMLAHAASAQGRVALGNDMPLSPIPSVIFTAPECASVGLTEKQCEENGIDFTVGRSTFRSNGKAMTAGETDGMVKIIVERTSLRILGCHICGAHAADLIAELVLAISSGMKATDIIRSVHAHPTLGEAVVAALR